ncbi:MAG: T9SS type A sorting domain-containing protein [Chitinophagales bacterium]
MNHYCTIMFAATAILFYANTYAQKVSNDAALLEEISQAPEEIEPAGFYEHTVNIEDALSKEDRTYIWENIRANSQILHQQGIIPDHSTAHLAAGGYKWPLKLATGDWVYDWNAFTFNTNFVDQDPVYGSLLDYRCGTRTYDITGYNHQGQDIALWPFDWNLVEGDYAEVVAAKDGWITFKQDGNDYHNCGFGGGDWNAIYLEHDDGGITWYGHMKEGSLTDSAVGAFIAQGEYLGIVASSGQSTGPHLHFEVYDGDENLRDPNGGPCNFMGGTTLWSAQRKYNDAKIHALYTHSELPVFEPCPDEHITNISNSFEFGDPIHFIGYFSETVTGLNSRYRILRPDGSTYLFWTYSFPVGFAASYWYWTYTLPDIEGDWKFQAAFRGKFIEYTFNLHPALKDDDDDYNRMGEDFSADVYPVPASASITITTSRELENATIKIFDMVGNLVQQHLMAQTSNFQAELDIRNLATGVYMISIESGGNTVIKKITKE